MSPIINMTHFFSQMKSLFHITYSISISANFCALAVIAMTAKRAVKSIFFMSFCCLEFLSEDEVELSSTLLSEHFVEAVGIVDTHQTHHREEDAYSERFISNGLNFFVSVHALPASAKPSP